MNINNQKHDKMAAILDKEIQNSNPSSFMDAMQDELVSTSLDYTDNGALVYSTSGSELVDFNFNISSKRSQTAQEISSDFIAIYLKDKEAAMRYLFFLRDIREGLGERHIFNSVMTNLAKTEPEIAKAVLRLIPEYGRWDEVVNLLNTPIKKDVVNLIKTQLDSDLKAVENNGTLSLCAKWMPSLQASNNEVRRNAVKLCNELGMEKGDYRRMLSHLRNNLNIIEKALAEKDIEKLDGMQEMLTSRQNYKYKNALMRLMPEQRMEYFNKVLRGEANFNVDVLEPHEIYFRYRAAEGRYHYYPTKEDISYEVMWKMLPNKVQSDKEVLVIRDGSGSMECPLSGTNNGTVLDVASALTIYFAEHSKGQFKDKFITFSATPKIVNLSGCDTLQEKIQQLSHYTEVSNTNLEATFDLILNTAIKNNMTQDDMPKNLLIVSDMQFDMATCKDSQRWSNPKSVWNETLFDTIRSKYEDAGYQLPGLIFWNVNQEKTSIPEIKNELGLVLLGGYSKNNIDMICNNEFTKEIVNEKGEVEKVTKTPEEILMEQIFSPRYDAISQAIQPVLDYKKQFRTNIEQNNEER